MSPEQVLAINAGIPAIVDGLDTLIGNLKNKKKDKKDKQEGGVLLGPLRVLQGLFTQVSKLFDGAFKLVFRGVQAVIDSTVALADRSIDSGFICDVTVTSATFLVEFVQTVLFANLYRNEDGSASLFVNSEDAASCDADLMLCQYVAFLSDEISTLLDAALNDADVAP